jgi:lysophospholipase L1-like esterase
MQDSDKEKLLVNNHKGKTIVCLGDSIFGGSQGRLGVCQQIAARISGTVINGAFGGTRMSVRGQINGYEKFDFPSLAQAIASGDYSEQEQAMANYSLPSDYKMSMQALKNTDFNEVDIITFNYGTNDWASAIVADEYKAAMENSVSTILQAYPHIRFVEITPTWRCEKSNGTITWDSDSKTYGGVTLPQVIENMKEVADNILHIPVIDCYNIGINKYNFAHYFDGTDGTHQNANGRELIAKRIVHGLF